MLLNGLLPKQKIFYDLAGRRSYARAKATLTAKQTGTTTKVVYRGSGGATETVTVTPSGSTSTKTQAQQEAETRAKISSELAQKQEQVRRDQELKRQTIEKTQRVVTAKQELARKQEATRQQVVREIATKQEVAKQKAGSTYVKASEFIRDKYSQVRESKPAQVYAKAYRGYSSFIRNAPSFPGSTLVGIPRTPSVPQAEKFAKEVGDFWRKPKGDTTSYAMKGGKQGTGRTLEQYKADRQKSREYQAEIIEKATRKTLAYPREHPVKTGLMVASPAIIRGVSAGAKVGVGKATIMASDKVRAVAGPKVASVATKVATTGAKVGGTAIKVGVAGLYGKSKVDKYKSAKTPGEKGEVIGETIAEVGAFGLGAVTTAGSTMPFEKQAEFVRGRLAIRSSYKYGTDKNIGLYDDTTKLTKGLIKTDVGKPIKDPTFKNVKSITKREVKVAKKELIKQEAVIQGSLTQGTYYNKKLEAQFLKGRGGKYGDIDYFVKDAKAIKGIEKVSDVHSYGERYIWRRSPFTKEEVLTPKGFKITSFQEQSGKLFSGATTQRDGEFYRAGEDIYKLAYQYKLAQSKGLTTPKMDTAFKNIVTNVKTPPKVAGDFDFSNIKFSTISPSGAYSSTAPLISPIPTIKTTTRTSPRPSPKSASPSFIRSPSPTIRSASSSPSRISPSPSPSPIRRSPSLSPSRSPSRSPSPPSSSPSPSRSPSGSPSPPSKSPSISPPSRSPSPSLSPSPSPSPRIPSPSPVGKFPTSITNALPAITFKPQGRSQTKMPKLPAFRQSRRYTPTLHATAGGIRRVTPLPKNNKKKGKLRFAFTGLEQRGI